MRKNSGSSLSRNRISTLSAVTIASDIRSIGERENVRSSASNPSPAARPRKREIQVLEDIFISESEPTVFIRMTARSDIHSGISIRKCPKTPVLTREIGRRVRRSGSPRGRKMRPRPSADIRTFHPPAPRPPPSPAPTPLNRAHSLPQLPPARPQLLGRLMELSFPRKLEFRE